MAVITYLNSFPAENALDILAANGRHEVIRIDGDGPIQQSFDTLGRAHAYQCVGARDEVPEPLRVDPGFLEKAPNLLVVSSGGSGVDVFDLDACTDAGVLVVNQAGSNAEAVAEHTLAMMISVLKNIALSDRALRKGWTGSRRSLMGRDLFGTTVGIVGLGNIGRRVAEICRNGFKCETLAYDPYLSVEEIRARHAEPSTFSALLARSDIVTIHTPLTSETRQMLDADAFSAMRTGSVFITTARGSIHDEDALAAALESGHIAGAGLDVWDHEPPQAAHRLLHFDNVVASPHIAGVTTDGLNNMAEYAATQLLELFDGKAPPRPVNPEVLPRYYERYKAIIESN